jgi:DNA-binding response OmpR family regulator
VFTKFPEGRSKYKSGADSCQAARRLATVHSRALVRAFRFGPYELDPACELRKFESRIKLQKKRFLLLPALVARSGEIVSRSEALNP